MKTQKLLKSITDLQVCQERHTTLSELLELL